MNDSPEDNVSKILHHYHMNLILEIDQADWLDDMDEDEEDEQNRYLSALTKGGVVQVSD